MEPQNETRKLAQIIFHAIDNVQFGKHKLACFLKGSRAKEIIPRMHENVFGGLFWHTTSTIEGFIEQLETMGFIERKEKPGYPYPFTVYVLTDAGRKAMADKIHITLLEIKKEKAITIGDSEKQTLNLFKQGNTVYNIAKLQNLTESTIYTHFYKLVSNGNITSSEIIPANVQKIIIKACAKFEKRPLLKEIKECLPDEITYDQIRCVAAEYFGREEK